MRKTIILLIVALSLGTLFLFPLFVETPKILVSADKLATISPNYDFQANTTDTTKQDILTAQDTAINIPHFNFTKMAFQTAAVILENSSKNTQKLTLLGKDSNGTWYSTQQPIGYFQQVDDLQISDRNQIISVTGGNIGTTLLWASMSLGIGILLILLVNIQDFPNKQFQQATT